MHCDHGEAGVARRADQAIDRDGIDSKLINAPNLISILGHAN
jgi:hypothetical protein